MPLRTSLQVKKERILISMLPEEKCKLERAKQVLDELITHTDKTLTDRKSQITSVLVKSNQTESQIKEHFWKAIQYLLSEDKRLIRELNELKDSQLRQLHDEIDTDYKALQLYQGKLHLIKQALESDSDNVTDVDELCKYVHKVCENSNKSDIPIIADEIEFVCDKEMLLESIRKVQHEVVKVSVPVPSQSSAPVLSDVLNAKTPQDITDPDIRDVVVVDAQAVKAVVVTDWNNRSIKSFYKEKNKPQHSVLVTGGWPFGVTSNGDNNVFVTDPVLKKILRLLVYPDLRITLTISTDRMYCGIASLGESKLVASGYEWSNTWASFWTVDMIDTKGTTVKSIKDRVLQSPEYICTSSQGNIVASDKGSKSLVYLSCDGDEYLTVSPTGESLYRLPQGVTVTQSGNVLLVDTVTNKVIEMTASGEYIKDLLTSEDELDKPRGIFADGEGFVYITCRECVRVYRYS